MMREIEQFYSTQIEEMPMFVNPNHHIIITTLLTTILALQERCGPYLSNLLNKIKKPLKQISKSYNTPEFSIARGEMWKTCDWCFFCFFFCRFILFVPSLV